VLSTALLGAHAAHAQPGGAPPLPPPDPNYPPPYGPAPYPYPPPQYSYGDEGPLRPVRLPPPLPAHHLSPRNALWIGVRGGFETPLGDAFVDHAGDVFTERDLIGSGALTEVDVGGRFGRKFLPFLFFAHFFAAKGAASRVPPPRTSTAGIVQPTINDASVTSSSANLLGFGFRYAFNPDKVGFLAELTFALRFVDVRFSDGSKLSAQAPGEFRLGLGADIRISELLGLSPMAILSAGSYSDVTVKYGGSGTDKSAIEDIGSHGYVGLQLGGHFDLFGKYD
jgi:hypothetical protein